MGPAFKDELFEEENHFDTLRIEGEKYGITKLGSGQFVPIGKPVAHSRPRLGDLYYSYLEIRTEEDTAKFIGETAVFSALQEKGNLDWRLIIRKE